MAEISSGLSYPKKAPEHPNYEQMNATVTGCCGL